ncbi:hypothetical protein PORCRE_1440 [Porphyromonas crevioricanis JCM 15906]|uniref:Uncharacterized protein n=1 Tax=Porphyromonas crevioricanis JCM 15906 TaxID=1305617 RepID=T1CRP1_9PORP|nr:hypothetical protein PORCRE_1440 [Porphyromonas crevioricanis JCM 15906]GAD07509.1 hypothetical protein PORCAN_1130 [Porphyromonas crevioricanis JCM 13913]
MLLYLQRAPVSFAHILGFSANLSKNDLRSVSKRSPSSG